MATLFKASEDVKGAMNKVLAEVAKVREEFLSNLERVEFSLHNYCNILSDRLL